MVEDRTMTSAHHLSPRWAPAIAVWLSVLPLGCATGHSSAGASRGPVMRPLSVPVALVAGDVEAESGEAGAFSPLTREAPRASVTNVRAAHGGAVLLGTIERPRAKVWLR